MGKVFVAETEKMLEIKNGTVISVKHDSLNNSVLSIVKKIENQSIYFKMPREFSKKNIQLGDTLVLQLCDNKNEYYIKAAIFDIDYNYPSFIHVHADKVQKYKSSRPRRYIVSIPAFVMIPGYNKELVAEISNISHTGVKILFNGYTEKQSNIEVVVRAIISWGQNLRFSAKLIRVASKFGFDEYGFEITKIDDENKDILDKLIYKLEEDEKSLIAEYLR